MVSKLDKQLWRSELFFHLDGLVVAPLAFTLYQKGVWEYLIKHQEVVLSELSTHFNANAGYLNVALRAMGSQGWLQYDINVDNIVSCSINQNTKLAAEYASLYRDAVELMQVGEQYHPRKFEKSPFLQMQKVMDRYLEQVSFSVSSGTNPVREQVLKHIEGVLVGPTIVHLGMGGMFHKYFMEASFAPEEFHKDPESFRTILDFLTQLGWFIKKKSNYTFTEKGLFFARRASAYGVTVSYQPMLRHVNDLIFGNPTLLESSAGQSERHVDREMNVWGSGGAHTTYFKKVDDIIIDIFNQPLQDQPKGILDMGCGNGAFLIHVFEVIEQRTLRGKHLEDYPLFLVGADYNQAAIKVTRTNLIQADIWAKVIHGDISDPDQLAQDLMEDYNIALDDLLNVRTFLDHNRIWSNPPEVLMLEKMPLSTGAFAFKGRQLSNVDVASNLLHHFNMWTPYISKYGLLVIELHTVSPKLTATKLGRTAATAYDVTHGLSDQYIVELDVFESVARLAGLQSIPKYRALFPDDELTTVSIHLLKGIQD
jgi:hypothetical protein